MHLLSSSIPLQAIWKFKESPYSLFNNSIDFTLCNWMKLDIGYFANVFSLWTQLCLSQTEVLREVVGETVISDTQTYTHKTKIPRRQTRGSATTAVSLMRRNILADHFCFRAIMQCIFCSLQIQGTARLKYKTYEFLFMRSKNRS